MEVNVTKFNEKGIDKKMREAALKKIKERLEKIHCSEHNQPPQIELSPDGLKYNIVKTCCESFLKEIKRSFEK